VFCMNQSPFDCIVILKRGSVDGRMEGHWGCFHFLATLGLRISKSNLSTFCCTQLIWKPHPSVQRSLQGQMLDLLLTTLLAQAPRQVAKQQSRWLSKPTFLFPPWSSVTLPWCQSCPKLLLSSNQTACAPCPASSQEPSCWPLLTCTPNADCLPLRSLTLLPSASWLFTKNLPT